MSKIMECDALTGEIVIRDYTAAEEAQRVLDADEKIKRDQERATQEAARAALLTRLGITEAEAQLLLGGM